MGVAAGLADWTGVDALIIRLGLVAALLMTGPIVTPVLRSHRLAGVGPLIPRQPSLTFTG